MAGIKDPAIKLFGKTIQLGSNLNADPGLSSRFESSAPPPAASTTLPDCECAASPHNILCPKQGENRGDEKSSVEESIDSKIEEDRSSSSVLEECKTPPNSSTPAENAKSPKKEDQSDQTSSTRTRDQNSPKKPDKILPCPRCNSMNTKFCYFNNYNVNQPRHFCKNCHRYWTAGGTMRNVPVGAGRRKNKNSSASHHRTLVMPEPHGALVHHALRPNATVFPCDSNFPLSKSMASTWNLTEKPPPCVPNGKKNLGSLSNASLTWNPSPWGSRFSMSLYPTPPNWTSGTWDWQWVLTPQDCPDQSSSTTSSDSSSLGKHSRDETLLKVSGCKNKENAENERGVVSKTLKIDDPTEAGKSSIWDTLRIKNNKVCSSNGVGGFFTGVHPTKVIIDHEKSDSRLEGSYMVLQANPAAFSRSMGFHESAHSSC